MCVMTYSILATDSSCVMGTGSDIRAKGVIENISVPEEAREKDIVSITIRCKNIGGSDGVFAIILCISTAPHTSCNITEYVSEAFILSSGESKDVTQTVTMPSSLISYAVELQRDE